VSVAPVFYFSCEIYFFNKCFGACQLEDEARKLQEAGQFKARPADVIHKKPFKPKKSQRPLTDITTEDLNTERRAKERKEFNTMIKAENAKLEELRKLVCIYNFTK
jgi:3-deoxy-D-arabino-heptulosonate 7-phosphate (DAHP) synthase